MNVRRPALFLGAVSLLAALTVSAQPVPDKRLSEIYAMSPAQMAETSGWIRSRSERLLAHINSIKDPKIRELVLDMVNNPRSTVFNQAAEKNSFWFSPAAGGPGHHFYPGGLAVHAVENIEVSLGWADTMAKVHGVDNANRDMII